MQQAESCIVTHPDSALIYLSTLDSSIKDEPEETRMYYGLLTIKAKDKLYITHTSDSLIKTIARFYEDYGDADKRMEAYHYLGSVYRDMDDAPQAVKAFQRAIDAGKGSKRYDILKRIYGQMGTLFSHQGMYEEAMVIYKTSYQYYQKQNEGNGVAIALRNIARMYDATNKTDSAVCFYEEAYRKAEEQGDKSTKDNVLRELGCLYVDWGKFDTAKTVFSKASTIEKKGNALLGLGEIYQNTSQVDSARYYFNAALQYGNRYVKESAFLSLSKIEASKGNYRAALDYAYKSKELTDSIKQITRTEAISKIHSLYNYQHIEKENYELIRDYEKKKIQVYQLVLILILIVFIAVGNTYYLVRRKRAAREQEKKIQQLKEAQYANSLDSVEKNKQKVYELEGLLLQAESQKDTLRKQLIQSQKELLEISNHKILATQNEKGLLELSLKKSEIYLYFHEISHNENIKIQENKWNELRSAIDMTFSNFTTQLYALCPQISELELHICYLIKISMQVKDIARLVDRSTSAITASRIRLYKKIHETEGTADMMDKFIIDL
ncbi:MAG: tetratricopeptide repeat protein [Tannerellaceae bacterium]